MSKKYKVETLFSYGWDCCWYEDGDEDEEKPCLYDTVEEAQADIDDLIEGTIQAVEMGNMDEPYDPDDYRIVEVTT